MSYIRVLPRDLFNEANFLKCVGALWIAIENKENVRFEQEDVDNFDIAQCSDDGSLTITNITLLIKKRRYSIFRPLNSREAWPIYVREQGNYEEIYVFDPSGGLSSEFKDLIQ